MKAIAETKKEEPIGSKTSREDVGKSRSQHSFHPTNFNDLNAQSSTLSPDNNDLIEFFESSSQESMRDVFNEAQMEISSYSDISDICRNES
ncbi:unnamed protein product [Chironomus riparius]|uniref:Uncharacterized protein n=1 Tax=Chironomus riparius TaxID=315576 RepID=A0A9N9WU86_9DIPT|nr:unnamed protein product [Chironomus riparius]